MLRAKQQGILAKLFASLTIMCAFLANVCAAGAQDIIAEVGEGTSGEPRGKSTFYRGGRWPDYGVDFHA